MGKNKIIAVNNRKNENSRAGIPVDRIDNRIVHQTGNNGNNRDEALIRASILKKSIKDYLDVADKIPTGYREWANIKERQEHIRHYFNATTKEWKSWEWQLDNRINETEVLKELLPVSDEEIAEIETTGSKYRWAVSPYYLSLIDPGNISDPVRKQAIPTISEYEDPYGKLDPMNENNTSPAPAVTRRYPDRLIINVTNCCAMYCRHCQRRRNIGEEDFNTNRQELADALEYVRRNPEIRDVLLTGGDAFMLENSEIDWLLTELEKIPHVEIKRLGTRTPVTLPYRIDDGLCEVLSRHLPIYVNTQFNHPVEITPEVRDACIKMARSGVALGNQAVLLKGINNDPYVMRKLNQELLRVMIRPYYIFHAKAVRGTTHFRTKVEEGLEIMEKLRGYTSGMAIPTFIVNSPGGNGKTPLLPSYLLDFYPKKVCLRTWENLVVDYDNR